MLHRLFPPSADNAFPGARLALWIFGLVLLMKAAIGFNSTFFSRMVATHADGIPIDSFTPDGAHTVLSMFALWGVSQLVLCLLGLVVLVRYRGMVPLFFTVLLLEYFCRRLVHHFVPIPTYGTATSTIVNLLQPALMMLGLALSLTRRNAVSTR